MPRFRLPIIVFDDTGAFGNRVVTHIYALALAAKTETPLINLCLWRYRRYLMGGRIWVFRPWSNEHGLLCHDLEPPRQVLLRRWFRTRPGRLGGLYRRLFVHDNEDFFTLRDIAERALGLLLRKALAHPSIRNTIRRWYRIQEYYLDDHKFVLALPPTVPDSIHPSRILAAEMDRFVKPYVRIRPTYAKAGLDAVRSTSSNNGKPVVGAHVRRGDYRVYRGGRWWFSDTVYADAIHRLSRLFFGRPCRVVLVSQDPLDNLRTLIPDSTVVAGSLIEDFCALGACDLIIAPPSTYSGLASYLFDKPLYQIGESNLGEVNRDTIKPWQPRWY